VGDGAHVSAWCAICGDDIVGEVRREPLGKDDALVAVCDDCATKAPQEARGPDRGYQVRDVTPGATARERPTSAKRAIVDVGPSLAVAPRRTRGPRLRGALTGRPTPGFIIVRVPRIVAGRSIDKAEAQESLRDQPWFADLQILGTTSKWHLFQRPDPDLVAKSRQQLNGADPDPIGWLERRSRKC
jgi:hypothetical protein